MTSSTMTRRNLHIPDTLWAEAEVVAERESERRGERVAVAEIIRRALREYLSRSSAE